jgi:hypothetical protein
MDLGGSSRRCAKCSAEMECGFLLDMAEGNSSGPAKWIGGSPERSYWTGVKMRGKVSYKVEVFRCKQCGYLEHYAVTEV